MAELVRLHEVGPRDGLQNEAAIIAVDRKIALIDLLARSGLRDIEVGSFVHPRWVPQMADTDRVMADITPDPAVRFAVLVPNMRGWDRFLAARPAQGNFEIAVFISASEGFSQSNLNCTVSESIAALTPVVTAARDAGIKVRGYVSCVVECPFDGLTDPYRVARAVAALRAVAPMPVSLGDTLGRARPTQIAEMLDAVLDVAGADVLAGHFHDTGGLALQNIEVALEKGLRAFDSSVGGLGGCPYAPGAPGNVATEDVVGLLHALGYDTGVDLDMLRGAAKMAKDMR